MTIFLTGIFIEVFTTYISTIVFEEQYIVYDCNNRPFVFSLIMIYTLYAFLIYPLYMTIKFINRINDDNSRMEWIATIYPISIFLIMIFSYDKFAYFSTMSICGFLLSLVANLLLIYFLYKNGIRKKTEAEILKSKKMIEIERKRYEILKERDKEVARIRHDYQNQLMTLLIMSEKKRNMSAEMKIKNEKTETAG